MQASSLRIAWRNLGRNRRRTGLALLAIAVGQWALLATQGLMRGYGDNIQRAVTGPVVGHIQIHHPDYRDERALDLVIEDAEAKLERLRELSPVTDAVGRIYAPALIAPRRDAFVAMVIGVDDRAESKPFGLLSGNATELEPRHVLVGYRLARKSGIKAGDEVALVGQAADGSLANDLFNVQAVVKGPSDIVNQSGVVMRIRDAQAFMGMSAQVHEIVVRANRLEEVEPLVAELKSSPFLAGLETLSWREIMPQMVIMIEMVDYCGLFVLVLVLIAAVAGIMNTLMMATYERMHEFGMLLALGCRPVRIVRIIMIEAVLLGVLGVATGTALGVGFVAAFQKTGIDMAAWGGERVEDLAYAGMRLPLEIVPRIELIDPVVGLASVVLVSLVAALWPAVVAGRLDPMEAMRS